MVCALPPYHIFGFNCEHDAGLADGGMQCADREPARYRRACSRSSAKPARSTAFPAVNTMFNAIANHPDFDKVDWSRAVAHVGRWRHGGAAGHRAGCGWKRPAAPICEGYGLSETSPSVTCNPVADSTAYSGGIGLPHARIPISKLIDDDGHEVATWAPRGEICDPRPASDGRLLAAPRRDRQGDDGRRLFPHRRRRREWTSAAISGSSTARRT